MQGKVLKFQTFILMLNDRRVTSVVKWILFKIIKIIPQRQAHFRQFKGTHAIFLEVNFVLNMLYLIKSKRLCLFDRLTYLN